MNPPIEQLQVSLLPVDVAHLAVPPLYLTGGVLLHAHNPVAQVVGPGLRRITNYGHLPSAC
jgi:hypothetical protein